MAEIILKTKIKLSGLKRVTVKSAGLNATDGKKMSKNAFQALKLLGYKPYGFKATKVTGGNLIKSDLIICMTKEHKSYISNFPNVYRSSELPSFTCILSKFS